MSESVTKNNNHNNNNDDGDDDDKRRRRVPQAATFEDKVRICVRSYEILVNTVGFPAEDIIFDPNILTVGTGLSEHNNYAVDFIEATRWSRGFTLRQARSARRCFLVSFWVLAAQTLQFPS